MAPGFLYVREALSLSYTPSSLRNTTACYVSHWIPDLVTPVIITRLPDCTRNCLNISKTAIFIFEGRKQISLKHLGGKALHQKLLVHSQESRSQKKGSWAPVFKHQDCTEVSRLLTTGLGPQPEWGSLWAQGWGGLRHSLPFSHHYPAL